MRAWVLGLGLLGAGAGLACAAEPRRAAAVPPPNAPAYAPAGETCDLFLHCSWSPIHRPPCAWRWRPTPEGPRKVRVCF